MSDIPSLDRMEQEKLFFELFPDNNFEDWQNFQKLVYNIVKRWEKIP